MTDAILVLNAGSSSIKFALYPATGSGPPLISGKIEGIGRAPDFCAHDAQGHDIAEDGLQEIEASAAHGELTVGLLDWVRHHHDGIDLVAAGHRVVHGGRLFAGPVMVNMQVLSELEELVPLAPLHQPHNLAAIRAISSWDPELPQVACFDTSFHRCQPRVAQLFGLPRQLSDEGIIKYGFHGLSYEYIASVLPDHIDRRADGRVIVAHLGNGASMCAMSRRQSIATSMGFTALHGLMMGRRCGTLDAGVVLYLIQQKGMSAPDVEHLLYHESGLLGVSGISNDMHTLENSTNPHAREAIDLYCYRAAGELAKLITALGGLDTVVFTAGIGENSSAVRKNICDRLNWLGVELNEIANAKNATSISAAGSGIDVLVIPTNEEAVIARSVRALIGVADDQQSAAQ